MGSAIAPARESWVRSLKRLPWLPLVVLVLVAGAAIFAPLITWHDPRSINMADRFIPPWKTWDHPLGTDTLGRDVLSRLVFGARISLGIGLIAVTVSTLIGTVLGLLSGYFGGWVDTVIMRLTEAALSFPFILAAMLIVVLLGQGLGNVIFAISSLLWARFSRMMRGEALSVRSLDYVTAARSIGAGPARIILRHIFPNVLNTLWVVATLQIGQVILTEASLSFLGLGVPPREPAWGLMVADGRNYIVSAWWLSVIPGIAIVLLIVAFNFFGDWLRDILDPRLRHLR